METLLVAGLSLVLGVMLGVGYGLARGARLTRQRRAVAGAAAGLAAFGLETLPVRSAGDILAGRIRVRLGGVTYDLPVLPRGASAEWVRRLDDRFASLSAALDQAGDDKPRILALLAGHTDWLIDILRDYDRAGILPGRTVIDEFATDAELLVASLEVWRAAHPLAASLLDSARQEPTTDWIGSEPLSSSPPPTAGDPSTSTESSPMSSSSPTSTPPRTVSGLTRRRTRSRVSRPSAPATSSPAMTASTGAGASGPGPRSPESSAAGA